MLSTIIPPLMVDDFIKIYPHKTVIYHYHSPKLHKQKKEGTKKPASAHTDTDTHNSTTDSLTTSIRRTKTTISDLILCNKFELFATFTFDPKKVDRSNPDACKKTMSNWLHSQKKLYPLLSYLIVPEYHKKHNALHFHALIKGLPRTSLKPAQKIGTDLKRKNLLAIKGRVEAPLTHNGREIYNINSYKSGFSTAIYIDNSDKVSSYVRKYITKDMPLFGGQKRYWATTGLIRPLVLRNCGVQNNPMITIKEKYKTDIYTIYETSTIISPTNYKESLTWHKSKSTKTLKTAFKPLNSSRENLHQETKKTLSNTSLLKLNGKKVIKRTLVTTR